MSCESCADLCVKYVIRTPNDLRKAIRIAAQNVQDGTITEIKADPDWNQFSFEECAKTMCWGDIVAYQFVCNRCGRRFTLGAETYHGSGGSWEPDKGKHPIID